ncbi:GNAT family N-acetyltransferase [Phytohabitans rumicis]|uniref:GNAT family N-acetyltransferase n=1 Tax=Phytohabitans rumicis TaxID=1076125 RepID=UPI0015672294|nr:GNAT family N-acetyltransferase [Phytohabitans rumicis]
MLTAELPDADCPDTYFTAGYGRASAIARGGDWHCLGWQDEILLPYVVNAVRDGMYDAASPYGYSGIHVAASRGADDLARFWQQVKEHWRDLGIVAMFFRFSPFDRESLHGVASLDDIALTRRGDTVAVKVDDGPDAVWNNLRSSCRRQIGKARRAGLTAQVRRALPADVEPGAPFRTLYEQTMKRVGSADGYLFADDYYLTLVNGLGEGLVIVEVKADDGRVVAASLVFAHRDRVHYHLAGSDGVSSAVGCNNLLLWTILSWAADSGRRWVHFGGGLRPDDSLFRFKETFGGCRKQFWTGAAVLDPAAYERLVHEHAAATGKTAAQLMESGYFPAYRFGKGLV